MAAPAKTGSIKKEERESSTIQEARIEETISPSSDYEDFKNNVTFLLENIMGSLSLITTRLDNLKKKLSPAQSQNKDTSLDAPAGDSHSSQPDATGLAERMIEKRAKTLEARERTYSTSEDLVSRRVDSRRERG